MMETSKVKITAKEFSAKFRSKREIYRFMTVDVKAYLCDVDCLTVYYLKDLMNSKKRQ